MGEAAAPVCGFEAVSDMGVASGVVLQRGEQGEDNKFEHPIAPTHRIGRAFQAVGRAAGTAIGADAGPHRVGHTDHRRARHGRVQARLVLDFDAINVLPATRDHVLLAVEPGKTAKVVRRDPGYGSTCKLICENALCLIGEVDRSMAGGGVWTPGAAMGLALVRRLQARAGSSFAIEA
jgi:hypothetical protein